MPAAANPSPPTHLHSDRHSLNTHGLHAHHLSLATAASQPGPTARTALRQPPQLALVLGSGGVKSIAGLGMLQALQAHKLQPDLFVGCSAGAVFAAFVARGDTVQEALQLASRLWSREITSKHRPRAWGQMVAPALTGFDEQFALRDDSLILDRMQQAFGDLLLQDLPVPLHVMATCAQTGEAVVITQGRVVDALRATVALPFLFAPWQVDGRLLMDGSMADPLPLAAAAHARHTVALGFACPMPKRMTGPGRLATRVVSALTNNLMHAHIAAADPQRCHVLLPVLERRVGLFDTHEMPALVALGLQQGLPVAAKVAAAVAMAAPAPVLREA
jgi:NTE family protein